MENNGREKIGLVTPTPEQQDRSLNQMYDLITTFNFHLTLYVLNFLEGTQTYIYILCHSSTLIRHRLLKFLLE